MAKPSDEVLLVQEENRRLQIMNRQATRRVVAISMVIATLIAVLYTGDPSCLWALFLPFWMIQKA